MAALHQKTGHNVTGEPKYPQARAHTKMKLAVRKEEEEGGEGEAVRGDREDTGERTMAASLVSLLAQSLYLCEHSRALFIHYPAMVPNEPGISTLTLPLG